MKKIILALSVFAISLSLAACGVKTPEPESVIEPEHIAQTTPTPEHTPKPEPKAVKVGVCIYKFDDCYLTLGRSDLPGYFLSRSDDNIQYECTIVDGKNDPVEQKKQIIEFIEQGYDVLLVNLVQSSSAAEVIDMIRDAGTPTVFFNRQPSEEDMQLWDKISYVGYDPRQAGTAQGEIIRDLPDHGDINGDGVVSYVMIMGDPENIDAQYRTEYSVKALTDAGIMTECLVRETGMWDQPRGQEITAAALEQYGDKIDVIFCNNDGMALGALQAIEAAGRTVGKDIYLVGADALDEVIQLIDDVRMTGTVFSSAESLTRKAADVAIDAYNGKPLEKYYMVDYIKIVK